MKFPLEHFITGHSLGVPQGGVGPPLTWSDGFIFEKGGLPDTDDIIREKLEGKLHWNFLHYAILEKYQSEFKVPGNIRIPVINLSDNEAFREMAAWVKRNFEKKGNKYRLDYFFPCLVFSPYPRRNVAYYYDLDEDFEQLPKIVKQLEEH